MQATRLAIPDVVLLKPRVFSDHRGNFFESFNERAFRDLKDPGGASTGLSHIGIRRPP